MTNAPFDFFNWQIKLVLHKIFLAPVTLGILVKPRKGQV